MFFYQTNHGAYSNPATKVGAPEQGFWQCFADGLDQSQVSSVVQANVPCTPSPRFSLLNFHKRSSDSDSIIGENQPNH